MNRLCKAELQILVNQEKQNRRKDDMDTAHPEDVELDQFSNETIKDKGGIHVPDLIQCGQVVFSEGYDLIEEEQFVMKEFFWKKEIDDLAGDEEEEQK
jgi:hypothetical protein